MNFVFQTTSMMGLMATILKWLLRIPQTKKMTTCLSPGGAAITARTLGTMIPIVGSLVSQRERITQRHAQTRKCKDGQTHTDGHAQKRAREHTRSDRVRHADRQKNSHWIIHTH